MRHVRAACASDLLTMVYGFSDLYIEGVHDDASALVLNAMTKLQQLTWVSAVFLYCLHWYRFSLWTYQGAGSSHWLA